jgi:uncharacterized membrane protein YczE
MDKFKKVMIYCLGLFFLAMGVTFSIKSQLGISPVNSIPYVLSLISGIEQGHVIIAVFTVFILVQVVLLKKDFKLINVFQIVFSTVFGYFVTFTNAIFSFPSPDSYFLKLGLLFISMILVAVGIIFYLRAEIIPMPAEGCMIAIQKITKKEFYKIKYSFDVSMVLVSIVLSILFLGGLNGVREGTIIAAIGIGKIIGFMERRFKSQIHRLVRFIQT